MGFTDSKPFSRAVQFRLVAMLTAAVFVLCVKAVWHESSLLAFARSQSTFTQAMSPRDALLVKPTAEHTLAEDAVEVNFSGMGPPNLWLIELNPNNWTIAFDDPTKELPLGSPLEGVDLANTRFMGPFQATIWTEQTMGLWASASYRLDHEFSWFGDSQHNLAMTEIRHIIASQWTTGGGRAINAFARANDTTPAHSFAPLYQGYMINIISISTLLSTIGLCFASFLVSSREAEHASTAAGSTTDQSSQDSHRSAA